MTHMKLRAPFILVLALVAGLAACGDTIAPSSPDSSITVEALSDNQIKVTWAASTEVHANLSHYNVYRAEEADSTAFKKIGQTGGLSYTDKDLPPSTEYCYAVTAEDVEGVESELINYEACVSTGDDESAPDTVEPLSLEAVGYEDWAAITLKYPSEFSGEQIETNAMLLQWDAPYDNGELDYYEVYERTEGLLNTTTTTYYLATGLGQQTLYCYYVLAYDEVGNVSETPTNYTCQYTGVDDFPPSAPEGFVANTISSGQIDLLWETSSDNVGVTGYKVYRDGTYIGATTSLYYYDFGVSNNSIYIYNVTAYDDEGNESVMSEEAPASTWDDDIFPDTPSNLTATALSITEIYLVHLPNEWVEMG